MTLSLDLKSLGKLGPKCLLVFLAGTVGVIIGGPMALYHGQNSISPELHPSGCLGSSCDPGRFLDRWWCESGIYEVSLPAFRKSFFSYSVAVDILVGASLWIECLLFLANKNAFDEPLAQGGSEAAGSIGPAETELKPEVASPALDYCWMVAVGFGGTSLCSMIACPPVD